MKTLQILTLSDDVLALGTDWSSFDELAPYVVVYEYLVDDPGTFDVNEFFIKLGISPDMYTFRFV